jgi:RNA polymerase-interacting CarD/CdnL/TRCF family regulator
MVVSVTHGLGRIASRNHRLGQEFVVVEFADGLTVSLPIGLAEQQLRAPASEADLRRVRDALRRERPLSDKPWLSRQHEARAKLSNGDIVSLAELVREGASRKELRTGKGGTAKLSDSEGRIYANARQRLADEIAEVRGQETGAAEKWIDEQLAAPERTGGVG